MEKRSYNEEEGETSEFTQWQKKVENIGKIIKLFKTKANAIIDEVDSTANPRKKLNYTIGESTPVNKKLIEVVEFFSFLKEVKFEGSPFID